MVLSNDENSEDDKSDNGDNGVIPNTFNQIMIKTKIIY